MLIFYGEDEQTTRDIVIRAFKAKGYDIYGLDTSHAEEMQSRLKKMQTEYGLPDIFILDGHNILLDSAGNKLYDMTPLGLVAWLRQHGIPTSCKFILYSNDDRLVEQAHANRHLQFVDAIPKGGEKGGLTALIRAVERAADL